jgi:WD40 repeat protein
MAFDTNRLTVLKESVPSEVRLRLSYHLDECWFVEFSPDGKWMASTGLDQAVIIWQDVLVRITFFIIIIIIIIIIIVRIQNHKSQQTQHRGIQKSSG